MLMCEFLINPHKKPELAFTENKHDFFKSTEALEFHRSLPDYNITPLHVLNTLSEKLHTGRIYIKDESFRFNVNAFKPLGASYSVFRFLKKKWEEKFQNEFKVLDFKDEQKLKQLGSFTFTAATDGNHGRAVAWTARMLRQKAVIYMPADSAPARINHIESEGADVVLVEGTFDQCVMQADHDARRYGRIVISDTAYPGYMEFPKYIMAGYTTIFRELDGIICHEDRCDVDVVIVQAGVGGLAAAASCYFAEKYGSARPIIICLEPVRADSFMESAKQGKPAPSKQDYNSVMAGLNCGVSLLAWDYVRDAADIFVSISDDFVPEAMRILYYPSGNDPRIISGESGCSGMAGLLALLNHKNLSEAAAGIFPGKNVLLINTEGNTDPENFNKIISQ